MLAYDNVMQHQEDDTYLHGKNNGLSKIRTGV